MLLTFEEFTGLKECSWAATMLVNYLLGKCQMRPASVQDSGLRQVYRAFKISVYCAQFIRTSSLGCGCRVLGLDRWSRIFMMNGGSSIRSSLFRQTSARSLVPWKKKTRINLPGWQAGVAKNPNSTGLTFTITELAISQRTQSSQVPWRPRPGKAFF